MSVAIMQVVSALEVGDAIKINDWEEPMRVCGVSDSYVLAHNGNKYTVIYKYPTTYPRYGIPAGSIECGPDYWVFGWGIEDYKFDDPAWVKSYLASWESGETKMSRNRVQVWDITVYSGIAK